MSGKPVATKADVTPAVSSAATGTTGSGKWSAGPTPLDVTTDARATVGGAPVALSAKQAFAFAPVTDGKSLVNSTNVSLEAGGTKFRVGGKSVLLDGDVKDDASDSGSTPPNKIQVAASGKLVSARS